MLFSRTQVVDLKYGKAAASWRGGIRHNTQGTIREALKNRKYFFKKSKLRKEKNEIQGEKHAGI